MIAGLKQFFDKWKQLVSLQLNLLKFKYNGNTCCSFELYILIFEKINNLK